MLGGTNGASRFHNTQRQYLWVSASARRTPQIHRLSPASIPSGISMASITTSHSSPERTVRTQRLSAELLPTQTIRGGGQTELYCIDNQLSPAIPSSVLSELLLTIVPYYDNQFGGTANITNFTDVHWGESQSAVVSVHPDPHECSRYRDQYQGRRFDERRHVSGMPYYIQDGGDISSDGTTFDSNSPVVTPVTTVVFLDNTNVATRPFHGKESRTTVKVADQPQRICIAEVRALQFLFRRKDTEQAMD